MQGGFVNLDIVVRYDNPRHIPFCTEIEITHSILRLNNPVTLSCKRSIARWARPNVVLSWRSDNLTYNHSFSTINCSKAECLVSVTHV